MGKPGLSAVSSDAGKVIMICYMYCITKFKTWSLPWPAHPGAELIGLQCRWRSGHWQGHFNKTEKYTVGCIVGRNHPVQYAEMASGEGSTVVTTKK